jgi:hypothetical protein
MMICEGLAVSTKSEILSIKAGNGGEGGIRTHGPDINRDNRLAGDPVQPLQHLSAA